MSYLFWLLISVCYICTGEAITLFTVFLVPQSITDKKDHFAWYWASARVLLWPLVLVFALFFSLSLPVQLVIERVQLRPKANSNLRKVS